MTVRGAAASVWLAPHIHVARDGDDLVVLDVEADAYYCLPHAAATLEVEAQGSKLSGLAPDVVEALAKVGALSDQGVARSCARIVPARDLAGSVARAVRPSELWDLLLSVLEALVRFRLHALSEIVSVAASAEGGDQAILERRALVFRTLWPWSPVQGACLFQALVLRLFLRRGGVGCAWVFGVRTWPFSAHCWLQSGDLVLNDLAERVGAYRPIMVT